MKKCIFNKGTFIREKRVFNPLSFYSLIGMNGGRRNVDFIFAKYVPTVHCLICRS